MATLTVLNVVNTGLIDALVAAAGGGDAFPNDGATFFEVLNSSGAPITVTFVSQATDDGLALTDLAVVVAAGERRHCGPFKKRIYNDSTGLVQVTYSGVTTLTVGPRRFNPATD